MQHGSRPVAEVSIPETVERCDNKTANEINEAWYQLSCLIATGATSCVCVCFWTEGCAGQHCEVNKSGSVFISFCFQAGFVGTLRTQFCTFASNLCQSTNHRGTCNHTSQGKKKKEHWLNFNTTTCNNTENSCKGKCQNETKAIVNNSFYMPCFKWDCFWLQIC